MKAIQHSCNGCFLECQKNLKVLWKVENTSKVTEEGQVNSQVHQPAASSPFKSSQDIVKTIFEVGL